MIKNLHNTTNRHGDTIYLLEKDDHLVKVTTSFVEETNNSHLRSGSTEAGVAFIDFPGGPMIYAGDIFDDTKIVHSIRHNREGVFLELSDD